MSQPDDQLDCVSKGRLSRQRRRRRAAWWGWVTLLYSHYEMVRALPLYRQSAPLAFAGLTPRHWAAPPQGRRPVWENTVSKRLRYFQLGLLVDPDEEIDENKENENENDAFNLMKGDETPPQQKRRDIREWLGSGEKSMVRPIRMEDGSIIEDEEPPQRMQANFDKIFSGMPAMDDILGGGTKDDEPLPVAQDDPPNPPSDENLRTSQEDDQWFRKTKENLEERYGKLLDEAVTELDQQRQDNPESVPDSSYSMVESMLKKEMDAELTASREQRSMDIMKELELQRLEEVETMDLTDVEDATVEKMIQEANVEAERLDAVQAKIESFNRYEEDAMRRAEESDVILPQENADLDKWALDRMEEMLDSQQNETTGIISENLEDSIDELRDRLETRKKQPLIQPETMKEWQMYRSIATRLNKQQLESESEGGEDEEAIASQLQSWKEFQQKEEEYRRQSGLSSGIKMPFDWQEAGKDPMDDLKPPAPIENDDRSPSEIRAELNQQALDAMEDVLKQGSIRSESLAQKIEELKKGLESQVELTEEENKEAEKVDPVDLSDVFRSKAPPKRPPSPKSSTWIEETDATAPPPDTPFFSSLDNTDSEATSSTASPEKSFFSATEEDNLEIETKPPPPDSPFFSADDDDVDIQAATGSVKEEESKLGSLEEQKLRSMYQRAGARTASEQEELRMKWEEYQKYEKESRDMSGLSDSSDSLNDTAAGYDMSDIVKEDGDIDAEKVLASIGPRPTRKRGNATLSDSTALESPGDTSSVQISDWEKDTDKALKQSELDPDEVSDQLYRAVSAAGGGRTRDDPKAKAKEKADFEDYLRKEDEARHNLDVMDDEGIESGPSTFMNEGSQEEPLDDVEYAEKVLESIGPRPKRKPKREISSYERDYSDRGGALSNLEDDVEDEEGADTDQERTEDDLLPEWFQKEQDDTRSQSSPSTSGGFLGSELFDDEEETEKNIRQAEEFGRRRRASSGQRQMGIDISDVLGRRGYEDFNDYTFDDFSSPGRDNGRSFSSFVSRKANLLEYTELDVKEVNALMDHKDSPYATGVSQYTKKINKPFSDFGAIFRLEGTLVDTTGLQFEAWNKVAEAFDFKPPELEDVRRAAVTLPDVAVRKIFFWSDDLLVCRDVALRHRSVMRDVFSKWMKDQCITASPPEDEEESAHVISVQGNSERNLTAGDPLIPRSEKELIELQWQAWTKTAEEYNFEPPSLDEILVAKVISPDDAVREAFHWTSDSSSTAGIVKTYQDYLRVLLGSPPSTNTVNTEISAEGDAAKSELGRSPGDDVVRSAGEDNAPSPSEKAKNMLEIEFTAWTRTAEERGLPPPYPEEAMVAMAINDPYVIVQDGFCWAEDPSEIDQLVSIYKKNVNELLQEQRGGNYIPPSPTKPTKKQKNAKEDAQELGPTDEEMLELHVFSWTVAAEKHGFEPPPLEEMQLAMNLDPEDAIARLFCWASDEEVISKVSATFQEARRKISDKMIKKYNMTVDRSQSEKPPATGVGGVSKKTPTNEEMFQLSLDAWTDVAEFYGYSLPSTDQVLYAMAVGAEDAALDGFKWTNNPEKAKEIAMLYRDAVEDLSTELKSAYQIDQGPALPPSIVEVEKVPPFFSVVPGSAKWVRCLLDVEMPCAVVSYLDQDQVDVLLEQAGLSNLFARGKRVSASSGYGRESQQLLGAALRVERRPDHCALFDTSPESAVIAHDVEMKCVNMIGVYPMYDLLSADSTARDFSDLTAMNLRRLFGDRVDDQPMLDMKQTQPSQGRKVKTRFWEEGDRF